MKISYILALFFLLSVFNADASEFIGIPTPVDPAPNRIELPIPEQNIVVDIPSNTEINGEMPEVVQQDNNVIISNPPAIVISPEESNSLRVGMIPIEPKKIENPKIEIIQNNYTNSIIATSNSVLNQDELKIVKKNNFFESIQSFFIKLFS
ncbi:hypothetical protein J4405_02075 [Candidatus Woesearchaeota archaeon]|nr:hypothetical protein [Candidatus Woesearchaeota archaeon]